MFPVQLSKTSGGAPHTSSTHCLHRERESMPPAKLGPCLCPASMQWNQPVHVQSPGDNVVRLLPELHHDITKTRGTQSSGTSPGAIPAARKVIHHR